MLHILIGYTDRPTALQLLAYVATLATMFLLIRMVRSNQSPRPTG